MAHFRVNVQNGQSHLSTGRTIEHPKRGRSDRKWTAIKQTFLLSLLSKLEQLSGLELDQIFDCARFGRLRLGPVVVVEVGHVADEGGLPGPDAGRRSDVGVGLGGGGGGGGERQPYGAAAEFLQSTDQHPTLHLQVGVAGLTQGGHPLANLERHPTTIRLKKCGYL